MAESGRRTVDAHVASTVPFPFERAHTFAKQYASNPMKTLLMTLSLVILSVSAAGAVDLGLPAAGVPGGLGVNIHFTDAVANARSLDMIQAAGVKFVRADFIWDNIEYSSPGQYNFKNQDSLVNACAARGMRVLFVLNDYGSPFYGNDPTSPTWRQAFTKFAATAAGRYKGNNVLWEMFNEPNGGLFPGGSTNPTVYMNVVKQAVPAMRAADSKATIIGPALGYGGMDTAYLTTCAKQGLFDLVDAISVHPYGESNPEAYFQNVYTTNRTLINTYHPSGAIPIVCSEVGWSATKVSPQTQGDYLARMNLVNLSQGIPLSIWYDWKNDGTDPNDEQSNFGTVTADLVAKPAYNEMQLLTKSLRGGTFYRKLANSHSDVWLLEFTGPGGLDTLAAWTTRSSGRTVTVPGWGTLRLTGTPIYVNPSPLPEPNTLVLVGCGLMALLMYPKARNTGRTKRVVL